MYVKQSERVWEEWQYMWKENSHVFDRVGSSEWETMIVCLRNYDGLCAMELFCVRESIIKKEVSLIEQEDSLNPHSFIGSQLWK